eukprot:7387345-Prymnesium_polylepis.1
MTKATLARERLQKPWRKRAAKVFPSKSSTPPVPVRRPLALSPPPRAPCARAVTHLNEEGRHAGAPLRSRPRPGLSPGLDSNSSVSCRPSSRRSCSTVCFLCTFLAYDRI